MHQREQEKCAQRQRTVATLTSIADQVITSRQLVDAAFIVAEDLADDQRGPLTTLLDLISDRLRSTATEIQARALQEAGTNAA